MKRNIFRLIAATALVVLALSCDKEKTAEPRSVVSLTNWVIDYKAQVVTVGFSVDKPRAGVEVTFSTKADWVKIGTPEGGKVTFEVSENDHRTQPRMAEIFFGYDGLSPQVLTLTQGYLQARIVLSREEESVDCQAQEVLVPVEIQDPIEGESFTVEGSSEWFSVEPEDNGIRFRAQENSAEENRSSTVTIGYPGAESVTLTLVQKPVKEYEIITGIKWAPNNCGYTEENPYGIRYNWKERETACPEGWRPANWKEMDILFANSSAWTSHNGVNGRWYSGKTEYSEGVPSIFLPASGACWDGTISKVGESGYYWTDELNNGGRGVRGRSFTKDWDGSSGTNTLSTTNEKSRFSLRCVMG